MLSFDNISSNDTAAALVERDAEPRPFSTCGPVAIVGAGVVGRALGGALAERDINVRYHDPPAGQTLPELGRCRVAFVCVPTPFCPKHGVDISAVRDALSALAPGTIAVIRSTVLPGTTEALQAEHPHLALFHCPEFLSEQSADEDERAPARQVLGYTTTSKPYAKHVMALLPRAPVCAFCVAREAEAIKYFANAFYALKVAYANQFYDLCQRLGVFWGMVQEVGLADPMMAPHHTEVVHKGYRGFGGKCLPKDVRALCHAARAAGVPLTLLEEALEYNETLAPPR